MGAALAIALMTQDVDALIRDLRADDVDKRERAQRELLASGEAIVPTLKTALEKEDDPEAAARLRVVLRALDPWFEDELLGTSPEGTHSFAVAPDLRSVAFVIGSGCHGRQRIVWRSVESETFALIQDLTFSPRGDRLAFKALELGATLPIKPGAHPPWHIVVDGRVGETFDRVEAPHFSADGRTVAFGAEKNGRVFAVIGDTKGDAFDSVSSPVFSLDGKVAAYRAYDGGRWSLVVDGKKVSTFDYISEPVFGPDGKTLAYIAKSDKKFFAVVGEKKSKGFENVEDLKFSPDGRRAAYTAREDGVMFIVVGDRCEPAYEVVLDSVFKPDGSSVAYVACEQGRQFVVVDGKAGEKFFAVTCPAFSPDGRTAAYAAKDDAGKWRLVIGDKKVDLAAVYVEGLAFNRDGTRLAFITEDGREIWRRVVTVRP